MFAKPNSYKQFRTQLKCNMSEISAVYLYNIKLHMGATLHKEYSKSTRESAISYPAGKYVFFQIPAESSQSLKRPTTVLRGVT